MSRLQYCFPIGTSGLDSVYVWDGGCEPLMLVKPPALSLAALFELRFFSCKVEQNYYWSHLKPFLVFFFFSLPAGEFLTVFPSLQIRKRLMVSDKGHLEWKKMYFKLSRCYPHREQYSDTLHFCTHCHILFWEVLFPFVFFLSPHTN